MSEPNRPRGDVLKPLAAKLSAQGPPGSHFEHVRCRLAAGSGPGFTDEMSQLLRGRLRLAILIILVGFISHFLRNMLVGSGFDHRPIRLIFNGCEIAVLMIASVFLWNRRPVSM